MTGVSDYIKPTEDRPGQCLCIADCFVCLELGKKGLARRIGGEGKGSFPSFPTRSSACAEWALLEQAEKLLCESQGEGTAQVYKVIARDIFLGTQ